MGHVALDLRPEQNADLGLLPLPPLSSSSTTTTTTTAPDGGDGDGDSDGDGERIVWVAGLYISHALQAGGLGGETMRIAEAIAAREPLRAGWIVLDTSMWCYFLVAIGMREGKRRERKGEAGRVFFL